MPPMKSFQGFLQLCAGPKDKDQCIFFIMLQYHNKHNFVVDEALNKA